MIHSHTPSQGHRHHNLSGRNLGISIVLNMLITVFQVIGGVISGSLSLLSDALHNFSDVVSLIISYIANLLSRKEASAHRTFGFKRAEIIAAFVNAATLILIAVLLIKEAVERFLDPREIESGMVIWLSLLGIVVNGSSVLLLRDDSQKNMNMKSAYLHLLSDMMASVAVFIGGILMKYLQWYWVDPLLTLAIALYLVYLGWNLLRDATRVLMLFTPESMEIEKIAQSILCLKHVKNVHHMHIWQLNEVEVHLEAHIDFTEDIRLSEFDAILEKIEKELYKNYGINHVTIQPEFGKCDNKQLIVQD